MRGAALQHARAQAGATGSRVIEGCCQGLSTPNSTSLRSTVSISADAQRACVGYAEAAAAELADQCQPAVGGGVRAGVGVGIVQEWRARSADAFPAAPLTVAAARLMFDKCR